MKSKYIWGGTLVVIGFLLICGWFLNWSIAMFLRFWPVLLIRLGLSGAADKKRFGVGDILLTVVGVLFLLRNLLNISLGGLIWGPVLGAVAILAGVQLLFGERDDKITVDGKEIKD